ncbi:MAG TPA: carboxymuconolactone decarboxylase family protein [Deltaproteobacteria bacterium]|nr:carboxymuconolactone decarboxylase family protein [Deltaproteobacteria bacterium]
MRLEKPRLAPLEPEEIDPEIRERFGDGPILNIFRTLAHHPKLMKRWLVFGNHVLAKNTLTPRERELAILRVGWLRKAEYEWAQHVAIALDSGLSQEEIERVPAGAGAAGWSESEVALLKAVDELVGDAFIEDETWQALGRFFDTEQIMDLIFTVGQYNLVSMALNSLGVQLEEGAKGFPES